MRMKNVIAMDKYHSHIKKFREMEYLKYHEFPVFSFSLRSHISGLILIFDPYDDTTPFVYLNLN